MRVNKLIVHRMLDYFYEPVVLVHELYMKTLSLIIDRSSESNCILTASQHVNTNRES